MARDAVIVEAVRTPVGKRNGAYKDTHPVDLSAHKDAWAPGRHVREDAPAEVPEVPGSPAVPVGAARDTSADTSVVPDETHLPHVEPGPGPDDSAFRRPSGTA